MSVKTLPLAVSLLVLACGASDAVAEGAADFYRGKILSLGVPNSTGGGYDVYGRALAHHIGKYIPGHPNVVVQNVRAAR
jgi:tripartite-type tricarboxylate transporter receptor subunit TctC